MKKKKEEKSSNQIDAKMYERMKKHLYSKKPVLGEDSPFSELLQEMINQMLAGEMDAFLAEEKTKQIKNKRNGKIGKQVISNNGLLHIQTPRDRNSDFDPELIGKRERELSSGVDQQILALYAQGNSIEDIRRLLVELYGLTISAGKISQITDKVLPVIEQWQNRPLQSFYAIVYLDAIFFKVRFEGQYQLRAFYTVYTIDWHGQRDLLGLYIQAGEGASRWASVMQDLHRRGVKDILVCCTDNLKGFSQVITDHFPSCIVQKCIVHQVRNSLKYVDEKDRKTVASDLRSIYTSITREQAQLALDSFSVKWSQQYKYIVKQWTDNWDELMAFMDFPSEMRRMIYTNNPVEALHRIVRKLIKGKAAWVSDTALIKQLYLSLMHNQKSWKKRARGWISIQRDLLSLYNTRISQWIE